MTLNQKRQLTGVNGDIKLKMKTYFLQKINNLFDVRYSFHNFLRNESTKYKKIFESDLESTTDQKCLRSSSVCYYWVVSSNSTN